MTTMNNTQLKRDYVPAYDLIRVIATVLVIIGHSSTLAITTATGSINPYASIDSLVVPSIAETIRKIIYSFHMPLYVCLSGMTFALSREDKNLGWLGKRFKRLVIPYILTAVFLHIPVRFIIGYYGTEWDLGTILIQDVILGYDINYLWFLQMLFCVNVLAFAGQKKLQTKNKWIEIAVLAVLYVVSVISYKLGVLPFQLHRVCELFFWFYVGIQFERNREKVIDCSSKRKAFVTIILWCGCMTLYYLLAVAIGSGRFPNMIVILAKLGKMLVKYMMEFFGCLSVILIANLCGEIKNKFYLTVKKYSFDIYLYHVPIMMLYRTIVNRLVPADLMTNGLYFVFLILNTAIGIIGPILLSKGLSILKHCLSRVNHQNANII